MRIISFMEFERYLHDERTVVIDLRDKKRYAKEHIGGSINMSYEDAIDNVVRFINKRVIFVCERGNLSLRAANAFAMRKVEAYSLGGGYRRFLK